jgi:hypothetical protein
MKLTGKCEEDFEKWLKKLFKHETERKFADVFMILDLQGYDFDDIPQSMQYGVYEDFFDSVGSYISVSGLILSKTYICDISVISNVEHYYDGFLTRAEARSKAIEKANEIYNKL